MFFAALHKMFGGHKAVVLPAPVVRYQRPAEAATVRRAPSRPLRIVRHGAGRMVISGRMADVCAELDRLAALEALQAGVAPAR